VIKVKHVIPNAERSRMVRYHLTYKSGNPAEVIPNDARQSFEAGAGKDAAAVKIENNTAVLKIESMGPADGQPGPAEVDAQYLRANALITSDDKQVRSLALRATKGIADPWRKASAIQKWVYDKVRTKNFKTAFAAANEVARNLSGDCTEHAVLAAAMCRAVGIPSRVVVGMIYVDEQGGFGYHMWDEVYVNQRWVAIDPSWNQSTVDAAHIKISDSSLEGVSPFEAFTPIIRVMGKLEIDPIEFR
jgi:transglutaminase-like putative cysteine protease